MKYLGIDYGKRKVGLAISEGLSVSPLKVIDSSSLEDALQKVLLVIGSEEITEVVIGVSESGESRGMTEKFIKQLEAHIPVIRVEETLSSHFADTQMRTLQVKKSKRGRNDAVAAAFILQEYIDTKS